MHTHVRMSCQLILTITITITRIFTTIIVIIIIVVMIIMIIIVIIIDVFGTCCQGSWPMMPASGSDQLWRPVLLACG